jgi:hypothetical protein
VPKKNNADDHYPAEDPQLVGLLSDVCKILESSHVVFVSMPNVMVFAEPNVYCFQQHNRADPFQPQFKSIGAVGSSEGNDVFVRCATWGIVFLERGYAATSLEAVAATAGVGKHPLYRRFPIKQRCSPHLVLVAAEALVREA